MERPGLASTPESLQPPRMRDTYTPPPQKAISMEDLAICASPGEFQQTPTKPRAQQKDKADSLGSMLRRGIVDHQLGLSVNLVLFVALSYVLFPALRERMSAFFTLSYPSKTQPGMYGQGPRDLYLVPSFFVFFTALRAFALDYLLMPLAGWCGIAKKKGRVRFAEQSYMMVYYAIYWGWGVLLFVRNTPEGVRSVHDVLLSLWTGWPYLLIGRGMKIYYLSQLAFWIQQIVIIHIEDRRKDHFQMLTHHIVTVTLMAGSYPHCHTRVGNAILVCMDLVDFVFPLAKILRYLSLQTACDTMFAIFVITWVLFRHVMYMAICWSLYAHVDEVVLPLGAYSTADGTLVSKGGGTNILDNMFQPMLHPEAQTISFNANARALYLGLLLFLQCITIMWFIMICRVVLRVLRGQGADDTRSDGEDEEDEELEEADMKTPTSIPIRAGPDAEKAQVRRFIEVESTSEDFVRSPRRKGSGSKRKSKGISSSLHLGEHKDILNRIGCLSEEQLAREREKREDSASPRPGSAADRK